MASEITARNGVIPKLREVFRENGYEGSSLAEITQKTGLGKSSLYHFFPKGKTEMAEAVLEDIDQWFEEYVFIPLRECDDPAAGIKSMFKEVNRYFNSGNRICLVGAFALDNTRDQFPEKIKEYFKAWVDSLTVTVKKICSTQTEARMMAEETVAGIQGALVLARAQNQSKVFTRIMKRLEQRILDEMNG